MKELNRYLGATYINSFQPAIMTKTLATFFDPEMQKITPDTGVERTNMDEEMTYPKN